MYLFSAIKDAIFAGRRSSVSGERPRLSESGGLRRSASEAYLLPQSSPTGSDREGPVGSKSKRLEPERSESLDLEPPKRRRTTIGGDRERISSRLSIDRADVPSLTSRARLPSPLPRQSMPGLVGGRRLSVLGSPVPVTHLNRVGGSPRASPRPQTPSHPKFVDLLRRDPSQQRALESARSILDTLDRVTTGGAVGGSARKYRPPQPLRPMRFKSLSSSRPVSLHDMLTGAVSSAPPSPAAPAVNKVSPRMQPLVLPGIASPRHLIPGQQQIPSIFSSKPTESPKHAPIPSIFGSKGAESPKPSIFGAKGSESPKPSIFGAKGGESPKRSFADLQLPVVGNKGADSPKRALIGNHGAESPKRALIGNHGAGEPVRQPSPPKKSAVAPSPLKKATEPAGPAPGGFVFGDPSKVNDADFFDEDCFAPGADDSSGSDSDNSPANVSGIFGGKAGGSIFGHTTPTGPMPSLFGSSAPVGEIKSIFGAPAGDKPASIFGAAATGGSMFGSAVAEKKSEPVSIFGSSVSTGEKKSEPTSIFGASAAEKKSEPASIFGSSVSTGEKKSEPASMFGAPAAEKKAEPASIFGSSVSTGEKKSEPASMFGAPAAEKKAEPVPIFGAAPTSGSIFASAPAEKKNDTTSIFGTAAPASGSTSSLFGAHPPANNDTVTFGGLSGATKANLPSSFPVPAEKKTESIFGSTAKPASPFGASASTIFGSTTAPAEPKPSTPFGVASATGSAFGAADLRPAPAQPDTPSAATAGMFVFGATPPASPHPNAQPTGVFGSTAPAGSIFGSTAPAPTSGMFGSTTSGSAPTSGMFGSTTSGSAPASGMFGSTAPGNMFGASTGSVGGSVFGAPAAFGGSTGSASAANPFATQPSQPNTPSHLFGAGSAPTPSGTSIFGNGSSGSIFGSAPGEQPSSAFSFGAAAAGTPSGGDNPFAASGDDFGKGAPKRKILKAARRT